MWVVSLVIQARLAAQSQDSKCVLDALVPAFPCLHHLVRSLAREGGPKTIHCCKIYTEAHKFKTIINFAMTATLHTNAASAAAS